MYKLNRMDSPRQTSSLVRTSSSFLMALVNDWNSSSSYCDWWHSSVSLCIMQKHFGSIYILIWLHALLVEWFELTYQLCLTQHFYNITMMSYTVLIRSLHLLVHYNQLTSRKLLIEQSVQQCIGTCWGSIVSSLLLCFSLVEYSDSWNALKLLLWLFSSLFANLSITTIQISCEYSLVKRRAVQF